MFVYYYTCRSYNVAHYFGYFVCWNRWGGFLLRRTELQSYEKLELLKTIVPEPAKDGECGNLQVFSL